MLAIIIIFSLVLLFFGVLRLAYIIPFPRSARARQARFHSSSSPKHPSKSSSKSKKNDAERKHHHVLIVLGSGGHTTEMLDLLPCMDTGRIVHRSYVFSSGDAYSATLARGFEEQLELKRRKKEEVDAGVVGVNPDAAGGVGGAASDQEEVTEEVEGEEGGNGREEFVIVDADEDAQQQQPQQQEGKGKGEEEAKPPPPSAKLRKPTPKSSPKLPAPAPAHDPKPAYSLHSIPRARRVHQPLYTAPYTSLISLLSCLSLLHELRHPSLIITNGPGTAVMLVLASYVYRFLGLSRSKIVYIESFTRVTELSLSGWLLLPFADRFLVQWKELCGKYKGVELLEMVDGVSVAERNGRKNDGEGVVKEGERDDAL